MIQSICLTMIVYNQSQTINTTLSNILDNIPITYWVICDIGSTDNTKQYIKDFFTTKNISGEMYDIESKNVAYNLSQALDYAFNKTDYLFIFDANNKINGTLELPEVLIHNSYWLQFDTNFVYYRPLLINNRMKWTFKSVLYEYLESIDNDSTFDGVELKGNYHIKSTVVDLDYKKQAEILQTEFEIELLKNIDIQLSYHYAFYCAHNYNNCGDIENSIKWYKKVLDDLNKWNQEQYCSCIQLGHLYKKKDCFDQSLYYYLKSIDYDNERIEGIVHAFNYLKEKKYNHCAILLYTKYKNYNRNPILLHKLFVDISIYKNHLFDFYCSISSYYIDDYVQLGYTCCKNILFSDNYSIHYNQTIINIMFSKYKSILLNDIDLLKILTHLSSYIIYKQYVLEYKIIDIFKELFNMCDLNLILTHTNPNIITVINKLPIMCSYKQISLNHSIIPYELNHSSPTHSHSKLPVIMCSHKRISGFKTTIKQLEIQTFKNFKLFVWNNNPDYTQDFSLILKNSSLDYELYNSPSNIGGFGRFYYAREIRKNPDFLDYCVFIDDDTTFGNEILDVFMKEKTKNTIYSHFGWKFNGLDYYNSWIGVYPGQEMHYAGTGGMILDMNVFDDDGLFSCPDDYWFVEDLWLSFYANHYLGYKCIKSSAKIILKNPDPTPDPNPLYKIVCSIKTPMLTYLVNTLHWSIPIN
jgi:hypothetical protein